MAAPTVYQNLTGDAGNIQGRLFAGKKFWVAQRIPTRTKYLDLIKNNGGEVVFVERRADYLIADHLKTGAPPSSLSYTFIDESIERGELQNPDNHPAGPPAGSVRVAGSLAPTKTVRAAYTAEEDRILYKWVRDSVQAGNLAGGNKIYQDLAKKYTRHTWQSWRDHYLNKLQHMSPSASNISENAPPSPPSDAPGETSASTRAPRKEPSVTKSAPKAIRVHSLEKIHSAEFTVDELTTPGLFSKEDWEQLYAFAEDIGSGASEQYRKGWEDWAESTTQTAGQWRQYYEKVVMPQWLNDPEEKRTRIRDRVSKRLQNQTEQEASDTEVEQETLEQEDMEAEPSTPTVKAQNKRKRVEGQAEAVTTNDQAENETVTLASGVFLSSSTVVNQTPTYITEAYEASLKKLRGETDQPPQDDPNRPTKRRKSASPELGTKDDPVEISSAGTDSGNPTQEDLPADNLPEPLVINDDLEKEDSDAPPYSNRNSPTPRASRYQIPAFDTLAILSPSQDASLHALPPPTDPSVDGSQSTTESLEEFSQFVTVDADTDADADAGLSALAHLPNLNLPAPSSPTPSASSSSDVGDPDPPLAPDEIDDFFEEQRNLGFTNDWIAEALKHTRWRPELTAEVLEAWEKGQALPNKRGVWSDEDDEDVEAGDGAALARLERKHTVDRWGGITERLNFLSRYRDVKGV